MSADRQLTLLSADQRNQLELILMGFDQSWQPELLEQYVQRIQANNDEKLIEPALSELVKIDLQRGWAAGQGRLLEEYCRRFPALGTPETLDPESILIEFETRREVEPQLDLGSYEARFPKQFRRLSELFSQIQQSDAGAVKQTSDTPQDQASIQTSRAGNVRATVSEPQQKRSDLPLEFGRYRIVRELGTGAMGAVYLAHDTQLDRQVALKTPNFDGVKDEELIARFYREARTAARLHHRNICPIYDVGEIDGRQYITMAFIKGRCLSEFIGPRKRPPVKTAAILILRLASALAEAHQHNVVHRDLKPANIMVDLKKEPVVMDFGLARQTDVESRVTQSGMMVGTPAYMSPEQVSGDPQEVGPQADIYALGVILYELLTGQLPFRGSIAQVVYQITSEEPTPPSQIRSEVDPELEAICRWMMAKDRSKRFQSMEEVANALRKYLKTPNVGTDAEVARKYQRDALSSSKPPVFKPIEESRASAEASTYALREYFGAEEAADPQRTAVESAPASAKPLKRMTSGRRGGDGHRTRLLAAASAGGLLLLVLGIILMLRTPQGMVRVETIGDLDGLEVLVDGESISLTSSEKWSAEEHELALRLNGVDLPLDRSTNEFVAVNDGQEQRLQVSIGSLRLSDTKFEVARDGETLLKISTVVAEGGQPSAQMAVFRITELNIGDYNTSPWPSQDGSRLYWEGKRTEAGTTRTVTLMASRPDVESKYGRSKVVAEGRMATLSPDELEIVCVSNDGQQSLQTARRTSLEEPFNDLQPLALPNEPVNPKSPAFAVDGLHLVVQSGPPEDNEFLISIRNSPTSRWSPFRQFGRMHERYHHDVLTWPFLSRDGLRIWFGLGGDRETVIWTGTRESTDEAFGEFEPIVVDGHPLVGRAPRYVAAARELYFARPVGEDGWELAVLKNCGPNGQSEQAFQPLFNGQDLSGWTVIGHDGWRVENSTIVGRASNNEKGWLMSNESFGDFELQLEYLLEPDSNSGIFLRAWPEGAVNGADFHEIQLLDDTSNLFRKFPPNQRTGSLFKQIAASPALKPEPNKWHRLAIRLQGRDLQVSIDGKNVIDGQISQDKQARGHIGLQLYPKEVQFWNIRIKDLGGIQ
jgi:serine/threonine protein kinase